MKENDNMSIEDIKDQIKHQPCIILAHELFDALPIYQFVVYISRLYI